ncbi:MAG: ribbon-helix-helix domain-containing protein [Deltaproteobacteria bacterium]|nr:ribbon-helix-helix domain-containing protein [Deltaproteobacteria bacterium]
MARKVPISLYLNQAQIDRLAKLREETKIPVSAHMRTAIDIYLNKAERNNRTATNLPIAEGLRKALAEHQLESH